MGPEGLPRGGRRPGQAATYDMKRALWCLMAGSERYLEGVVKVAVTERPKPSI
jgi:hypothetical protein